MRVLFVDIAKGPIAGGSSRRTLSLSTHLWRAGVDVRWLLLRAGVSEGAYCAAFGVPEDRVTWVDCLNRRFFLMSPRADIRPHIVEADVICLSTYLWGAGPPAWLHARRHGIPWVVSPHGTVPYFGRSRALKWLAHAACGRAILRGAAAVVAVTETERRALVPWVGPRTQLGVIPNGLDLDDEIAATDRPSRSDALHILVLGRLSPEKGVDVLLDALATVPAAQLGGLRLVIAGDGVERGRLEAQVARLNMSDRVTFAGWVDGSVKRRLLETAAFVAIPSTRDAMTLVALETGGAGLPLLISRACGFPQAASCGGAVEAVPTVDGLRTGLLQMLAARHTWPAMGQRLRHLVTHEYLWSQQAARLRTLLEEVVR